MYGKQIGKSSTRRFIAKDKKGTFFADMRMRVMTAGKAIAEEAWSCRSKSGKEAGKISDKLKVKIQADPCFKPLAEAILHYDDRSGFR